MMETETKEKRSLKEKVRGGLKEISTYMEIVGWVFLFIGMYEGIQLWLTTYGIDRPDLMWMVAVVFLFGGFGVKWLATHMFTDETLRSSTMRQSKEEQN